MPRTRGKKRTPKLNQKSETIKKKTRNRKKNNNNRCKMVTRSSVTKRTILNEYAINRSVPVDNPIRPSNSETCTDSSRDFYSERSFTSIDRPASDSNLNIKITLLSTNIEKDNHITSSISQENIMNLNSLTIADVSSLPNNNDVSKNVVVPLERSQKQSEPIEINDTPTKGIEDVPSNNLRDTSTITCEDDSVQLIDDVTLQNNNKDVILLDDTLQISDSDSDIVLLNGKRKNSSEDGSDNKRRRNSVIVIEDDTPDVIAIKRHKRKKNVPHFTKKNISSILSPISAGNSASTSCITVNKESLDYIPFASSTPNSSLILEPMFKTCLCKGLPHSCVLKPNLATIPEEIHNKSRKNLQFDSNKNHHNQLQPNQGTLCNVIKVELEQSLKEYDNELNVFGGNFLNAGEVRTVGLRPIFIDGSNVAIGHSNGRFFSVKGLKICIDYFKMRGHEVTAIVPRFRMKWNQNSDPLLLKNLEKEGTVVFTPSRTINGKNIVPYDDRFLVLLAAVYKGIIVSSDNFRDLLFENPYLSETIENRILNPTWLKDMIIFPEDPLGRYGPKLETFLKFP